VGGTSGIGLYTAREFVRRTLSPTIYLVGRNETRAGDIIAGLKLLNEGAQIYFIKADASLLMEVDSACDVIQRQVSHVNVLFLSCGIFTLNRREGRSECPSSTPADIYLTAIQKPPKASTEGSVSITTPACASSTT